MPFPSSLMRPDALAAHRLDIFVLKDRLHALFSRYGEVRRLDLVRADQGPDRRVMCFLRMGSPEQEQTLVEALGMGRFGGDLVMVIALDDPQTLAQPWMTANPQDLRTAGLR